MWQGKFKSSTLGAGSSVEPPPPEAGSTAERAEPAAAGSRRGGVDPSERHLTMAGAELQQVVTTLEGLLFDTPKLTHQCRSEIHDAIGLVMDALQTLGQAQRSLRRSRASQDQTAAHLLSEPMGRA